LQTLHGAYPEHELLSDAGSGLNWKRANFVALLDAAPAEISARVSAASPLRSSSTYCEAVAVNSWFCTKQMTLKVPQLSEERVLARSSLLSLSSLPATTESGPRPNAKPEKKPQLAPTQEPLKAKKWRIHPTASQKETLKLWLEATRWVYDKAAEAVNARRLSLAFEELRTIINNEQWLNPERTPARMEAVPYDVRDSPLQDLVKAAKPCARPASRCVSVVKRRLCCHNSAIEIAQLRNPAASGESCLEQSKTEVLCGPKITNACPMCSTTT
jgi:hypothetical protein